MSKHPIISVVTPIHSNNHKLVEIRKAISLATVPAELIISINNPKMKANISTRNPNETIVTCTQTGRGYALLEGIAEAVGAIVLLLHSDTVLLPGWDRAILSALSDPQVVGGAFCISYDDDSSPLLKMVGWISNQWAKLSGELYGDRAMFLRSSILRQCLPLLDVPLFEDFRLAGCMKNNGRIVVLKEKVETSSEKYLRFGFLGYVKRIWCSRIWYNSGVSIFQIYQYYYSDTGKNLLVR